MTLPKEVTANINGNKLNGIIYSLKTIYQITNPIKRGLIVPSATDTDKGNINNTIVEWVKTQWYTSISTSGLYYQVYFPIGSIEVTGYSLRGSSGAYYPKTWKVFGFNEDNKNDESSWDVLGENTSTASQPYCYTTSDNCNSYDVGTFTVKITNKFYKYVRFVMTNGSTSFGIGRFQLSGFDIFGVLSFLSNPIPQIYRVSCKTCKMKMRITSQYDLYLIIVMSLMQS
jgi:hypothetical protein